jgi:hypothetical protein
VRLPERFGKHCVTVNDIRMFPIGRRDVHIFLATAGSFWEKKRDVKKKNIFYKVNVTF